MEATDNVPYIVHMSEAQEGFDTAIHEGDVKML